MTALRKDQIDYARHLGIETVKDALEEMGRTRHLKISSEQKWNHVKTQEAWKIIARIWGAPYAWEMLSTPGPRYGAHHEVGIYDRGLYQ